jgi:eukaryotic-like serine/threonine-protein kinase
MGKVGRLVRLVRRMAQLFGKYRLINRIAVGGMAEIFVARREGMKGFQKTIVIKRIRPHLSEKNAFINMFLNEAKLAAELNHSNIAQIFDLGRIGTSYFIAMEYINGRDMRAVIPKAEKLGIPFPLEYSLKIAREACEGLYYAHRKTDEKGQPLHIVHRDVTPENIMVSFDGEVKLLDFGIAKAENLVSETRAGEIKGKLGYLSPEQITGKPVDHRSDLFSLGTVLYEWVTGHKLFTGRSDVDVLKSVLDGKIYPPSYFKEDVPQAVEDILMQALQRNREERYQTSWDMLYDIDQFFFTHKFSPSNIHLSNFMRQIFTDELNQALGQEELPEEDEDPGESGTQVVEKPEEMPGQGGSARVSFASSGTQAEKPVLLKNAKPATPEENRLAREILGTGGANKSILLHFDNGLYEKLRVIADRNDLSLEAFIRDVLSQYAKYLGPEPAAPSVEETEE